MNPSSWSTGLLAPSAVCKLQGLVTGTANLPPPSMGDLAQPKLPPELECYIFQLAARVTPELAPALILVAWRVKEWIEPLLYNTLIMHTHFSARMRNVSYTMDAFQLITRTKSPEFLRKNVVNCMLFIVSVNDARTVLAALQGVENLFISVRGRLADAQHVGHPIPPEVLNLPLKQLYTGIQEIVVLDKLDPRAYPCFRNLTHLELFTNPVAWGRDIVPWPDSEAEPPTSWAFLTRLPSLTHLALNNGCPDEVSEFLLSHCVSLHALLLITSRPPFAPLIMTNAPDSRFVVMVPMTLVGYLSDWKDGTLTGRDYWSRVDRFIARRLAGEIDSREFMLTDSED
ncbi:hypothetical protein C8F01DRAFT_1361339 [Mycena amicta]|nr:hypothetical protein C8F01DRAFT_1361339 [Mycena amicta]